VEDCHRRKAEKRGGVWWLMAYRRGHRSVAGGGGGRTRFEALFIGAWVGCRDTSRSGHEHPRRSG
jgi:hypothetical protein